jgi:cholesterol transport system auxiliary component
MNQHPTHCARALAQPRLRRSALALLCMASVAMLAACTGSLLPKPAPTPARYTLDGGAAMRLPHAAAASAPSLAVGVPSAASGYDSRHMVYMRHPQELEAFAFAEWVDTPTRMLQPLLVRALQDSGAFRVVLPAPSAAESGLRLETEVQRLQQDFTRHPSQVRLSMRAVLLDTASRHVLAWREFDVSVSATSDDPVAGALAAKVATQQLMEAIAAFCAQQATARN